MILHHNPGLLLSGAMRYAVYCHTSPSGKRYVGWTSYQERQRWLAHVNSAKMRRFEE